MVFLSKPAILEGTPRLLKYTSCSTSREASTAVMRKRSAYKKFVWHVKTAKQGWVSTHVTAIKGVSPFDMAIGYLRLAKSIALSSSRSPKREALDQAYDAMMRTKGPE